MKMQFVGSGAAMNKIDGQSNVLVISETGKKLLIDCGSYCWCFMEKLGLKVGDVDGVYVSHLHADHIGGMEELAFLTYFNPGLDRPKLFCNAQLMHDMWDQALRGGLESIQGKVVTLTEYFDCKPVENNDSFTWEGIDFTPVQTIHVMAGYYVKYSYGLLIQEQSTESKMVEKGYDALGNGMVNSYRRVEVPVENPTVFFTTDTQFCPNQIKDFYDKADIIFHDCETAPYESGVHASYPELSTLEEKHKNKMVLYHYQPNPPQREKVKEDGFIGFANRGQIFDISFESIEEMRNHKE
jgi:ribonuclease BN (tRNA processing enzyme)